MSSWYRTGTITVTNGSTTVTGSGTQFISNVAIGEALYAPDGRLYEITNIASDTVFTISPAYLGSTQAGQNYTIVPSQSYIRDLAAQAADLVNNYSTIANFAGQGKFGDGTLTEPGIRFSDDLDTGFYRSGTNEVTFVAGGVAQFKYNTSGLQFTGNLASPTVTGDLSIADKIVHTGDTNTAIRFPANDEVSIETAGSERVRVTGGGGFGINTSVPDAILDVNGSTKTNGGGTGSVVVNIEDSSRCPTMTFTRDGGGTSTNAFLKFVNSVGEVGQILTNGSAYFAGDVGIGTSSPVNLLDVSGSTPTLRVAGTSGTKPTLKLTSFGVDSWDIATETTGQLTFGNGSERMRIASGGSVFFGTTDTPNGTSVYGSSFSVGTFGRMILNMAASDASTRDLARFYNSNGQVGTIQVSGSSTSYNESSDVRLKENITDAPEASSDIDGIQVRSFDWKADGSHQKYGMIAQELDSVCPRAVSKGETEDDMWGVDYSKLVPMLVKEVQSLRKRIAQLEGN